MGQLWALFPNFEAKKIFPRNPAWSCSTLYEFLAPCQISENTNDTISWKCLDRRTDWRTVRPYFIGPFRLLPGVQKILPKIVKASLYLWGKVLTGNKSWGNIFWRAIFRVKRNSANLNCSLKKYATLKTTIQLQKQKHFKFRPCQLFHFTIFILMSLL